MLGLWFDYSQGRPSGAALKAAGAVGVVRYVGLSTTLPAKRLTAAELADLTGHGLVVFGAVESTTTRSNGGRAVGVADGRAALADPVTAHLPVLFATNDQPAWSQTNVDYVAGFQSVVGKGRTGVYGYGAFLAACSKAGLGTVYWQAGPAPSRTGTTGLAHFWQRQGGAVQPSDGPTSPTTIKVAGVPCDPNNQLRTLEDDVNLTDNITYTSRVDGAKKTVTVATALGKAADLFDQLTKGNGAAGGGSAGYWVNDFLDPDHDKLAAIADSLTKLQAAVAALQSAQQPATVLTGEATVTVNLAPQEQS